MKCAILAVGTELCLGQITNRNASWIAGRLHELGLFTPWHRVVPDDRELIVQEMQDLATKAEFLVVTGGLGPTTDDFTRDCVAEFLGRKLQWDEFSWSWIQTRLGDRGIPVREIQKQQCYYPEGAVVLKNERGTAHGFRVDVPAKKGQVLQQIFVLPGPPAEVESVFENGVRPILEPLRQTLDPLIVRSWDCLGLGESEVAHKVEAVLTDCPFEKAYRVHLPFVEFKLSFPLSKSKEAEVFCQRIEKALAGFTALRNGEDALSLLLARLENSNFKCGIAIQDRCTQGHLWQRFAPALKGHAWAGRVHLDQHSEGAPIFEKDLVLELLETSGTEAEARMTFNGQRRICQFTAPYRGNLMPERKRQFFLESALLFWAREISNFS